MSQTSIHLRRWKKTLKVHDSSSSSVDAGWQCVANEKMHGIVSQLFTAGRRVRRKGTCNVVHAARHLLWPDELCCYGITIWMPHARAATISGAGDLNAARSVHILPIRKSPVFS